MLATQPFYWGSIRSTIVAFGNLFSNIYIERRKDNSVIGDVVQTLHIPLSYAPREKWLVKLEQDPTQENHTYTTLPRMSFEITNYSYDSERNLNKMNRVTCRTPEGSPSTFVPAPWNLNISLYILTKNQEDGLQILEQILPTFNPEFTLAINVLSDLNIVHNVPFILNDVSVMDEYDGDFETRRFVTHTLNFTAKLNLYGPVSYPGPIYHTDVNLTSQPNLQNPFAKHHADGDPETMIITDEWLKDF